MDRGRSADRGDQFGGNYAQVFRHCGVRRDDHHLPHGEHRRCGRSDGGTGLDDSRPALPAAQRGYTAAEATAKDLAYANRLAARSAGIASGQVVPLSIPTDDSLIGFINYHQKTNYNCLPALGQSILYFNFGGAWTTPSVAAKQGTASQASGTITKGMHTTTSGTADDVAFAYLNGQFAAGGSGFRYIQTSLTSKAAFETKLVDEITNLNEMLYTRVDVTSPHYAWHQSTPEQHATGAIKYALSGDRVTIADPFTHENSSGVCVGLPYSSTPNVSCTWVNYDTNEYYLAKDVVRNSIQANFW
jgi:hypothetical protein